MGSGIELESYHLIVPSKSLSGHEIPSTFFFFTYLIKAQIIFFHLSNNHFLSLLIVPATRALHYALTGADVMVE